MDGKLIGINSSIYSSSGGNIGIGFAIPSNMTRVVVDGALDGGIKRPWLGADGQAVTAEIAGGLGLQRPEGVMIAQVYPGGPAAQAGVVKGDVLLSVDGFEVLDSNSLRYRIVTRRPGDNASIRFLRSGTTHDAIVRIALPPDQGRGEDVIDGPNPMQGARVANLTPALADELQMDMRSEEHTSELQSPDHLVCRLLLEKKKTKNTDKTRTTCANRKGPRTKLPPLAVTPTVPYSHDLKLCQDSFSYLCCKATSPMSSVH